MSPVHHGRYVAYYRVSTDRQGRTSLSITTKKKVLDYLNGGKWSLAASFTEVESGRKGDRRSCGRPSTTAGATRARRSSSPR